MPRTDRRHALGQWFTPPVVADLALSMALPAGASAMQGRLRILDPACGDGVFLHRATARGLHNLCGIEIDPSAASATRAGVPGAEIHCADLFDLDPARIGPVDVVIGNPPYVRQERLRRPYKQHIERVLAADWPQLPAEEFARLCKRGDLAAACMVRALRFMRPGARMSLVLSSALLDAGYADCLWRIVARLGRVEALIEAPQERWFADAAVNAMIVVISRAHAPRTTEHSDVKTSRHQRRGTKDHRGTDDDSITVARLTSSTSVAAERVGSLADLPLVAEVRQAPAADPRTWARFVRAPAAWFAFRDAAREALIPLGELAEVRRGITSGANDVFYLTRERAAAYAIEDELLAPLFRSPRGQSAIAIEPDTVAEVAVVCPSHARDLNAWPGARAYFARHRHVAERATLRGRDPWWALSARPAQLFLTKAYSARFVQCWARKPMVADQRAYTVHPHAGVDGMLLCAVLNSTYAALALESLGRSSMGEGALEWTVADAAELPVLDVGRLDAVADGGKGAEQADAVRAAISALMYRPIANIEREYAAADRICLDRAVAACAGGRTRKALDALRDDVRDALVESVQRRHARARSR